MRRAMARRSAHDATTDCSKSRSLMPGRRPAQSKRRPRADWAWRDCAVGSSRLVVCSSLLRNLAAGHGLLRASTWLTRNRDMPERIRIAVVDDHPLFRAGVVFTLQSAPDMMIVAEGATAYEA